MAYWLTYELQMKQVTQLITGSSIAFFLYILLEDKWQFTYMAIFLRFYFWAILLYENMHKINSCGLNNDLTFFLNGST